MISHILKVLAGAELLEEICFLSRIGLSDEEIEGYIEFTKDNYPELKEDGLRISMSKMSKDTREVSQDE